MFSLGRPVLKHLWIECSLICIEYVATQVELHGVFIYTVDRMTGRTGRTESRAWINISLNGEMKKQ